MLNNRLAQLTAFIKLGRPLFLLGGFVFHWLGILLAVVEGATFDLPIAILGQLAITSTQLMTQYSNEYFDLAADQANETISYWAGSSRVLVEKKLPPRVALLTALVLAVCALSFMISLTLARPEAPLTLPLLLSGMILAAQYSAPPLKLHWRGLGALTAALIVPTLTTLSGFYLQATYFTLYPFLLIIPLALLQAASIISLDFPDRKGDAAVGKKTLVVKLGPALAARLHLFLLLLCYLTLPVLYIIGMPGWVALASGLLAPAGFWQSWQLHRSAIGVPVNWNWVGFAGIALLIGTALLQAMALLLRYLL